MPRQEADGVRIGVLGPLEVRVHDRTLDLGGFRIRTLLALLAAAAGRVTSVGGLADALWDADPPPDAHRTVRTYVSRLRRALSLAAAALGVDDLVLTSPAGYALRAPRHLLDVQQCEQLVAGAREALAASRPEIAAERFSHALSLWRGDAYGEFAEVPALRAEVTRLRELRVVIAADRIDADLATGAGPALVGELTALTARYPGHDRLWAQLMIALYRAGRQVDALDAFARARTVLVERFGVDPSPRLVAVHRQVLNHDAVLLGTGAPAPTATVVTAVTATAVTAPRHPAGGARVVGRARELALLASAVAAAGAGQGGAVFVVGEPGLGKTRLAREAARLATAAGGAVVQGRATSPSVQFRPLAEALFSALRNGGGVPDDPELMPYRGVLSRLVPEWRVQRISGADDSLVVLAEAVLRVLCRLGRDSGCLVVLDDLHDADADTLEVVDYLVDNLAGAPVLLLGTVRPEPGRAMEVARAAERRGVAAVVELSRLSDDEVRELIALHTGAAAALPAGMVDRLLADGEGNPFYVEELLAGMAGHGDPAGGGPPAAGEVWRGVPAPVLASVTARVERLGPHGPAVLRSAAVFGQRFPASLVQAVAGVGETELNDVLRSGVDSRLITIAGDGGYSFRHALTVEALRAGMLPHERAALARRGAEAVEQAHAGRLDDWALVAGELWQEAGEKARAAELFGRCGRRAAAQGGLSTGIDLLERSLALMVDDREPLPPAAAGVLAALFEALVAAGQIVRATELSTRLTPTAPAEVRLTVHLGLARAAVTAGQFLAGQREIDRARRLVGPSAEPARTAPIDVVAAQLAFVDPDPGRLAEARALATRAFTAATRADLPEIACEALVVLGRCARAQDLDEAEELFGRALDLAMRHDLTLWRVRLLYHLGAQVGIRTADPAALVDARTEAVAAGALVTAVDIVGELAVVHLIRGEYDAAERYAVECEETARRLRIGEMPLVGLGLRVCVGAHRGGPVTELLDRYERAGGTGFEFAAAVWGFGMVFHALLQEDREQAVAYADRGAAAEADLPPQFVSYAHGPRLFLAVLAGREGWTGHAATEASASGKARWNGLFLSLAAAVLAGREGRTDVADRAVALFLAKAEPFPLARHLGLRLLAEAAIDDGWGDPATWLRTAEVYFDTVPAPRAAAACRTLLRRVGQPVRQRRRGIDNVPPALRLLGVTVREHEVLALVAARLSNREIGERLRISSRTVDTHVASLLAKTGEPHRNALAKKFAEFVRN